jgi:hypothetical protein
MILSLLEMSKVFAQNSLCSVFICLLIRYRKQCVRPRRSGPANGIHLWFCIWGWDFPWMAMATDRVGETQIVIGNQPEMDFGGKRNPDRQNDVHYAREVFVSQPDQVVVMRIAGDRPGAVSFTCQLRGVRNQAHSNFLKKNYPIMKGAAEFFLAFLVPHP